MSIGKNCAEFVFKIANDNLKNPSDRFKVVNSVVRWSLVDCTYEEWLSSGPFHKNSYDQLCS